VPIVATPQPDNTPPRIQVEVSNLPGTETNLTRTDADGKTRPVRAAEPAQLVAGGWTGFDYEAPLGVPVTYTAVTSPALDVNLLTENQESVEIGTTGWVAHSNCTIARSHFLGYVGSSSLRMDSVAAGDMAASTTRGTGGYPVIVGENYTGAAYARVNAGTPRDVSVTLTWFNASGTVVGTGATTRQSLPPATWQQVSVDGVAPVGAATGAIVVTIHGTTAGGEQHHVDLITVRRVPTSDPVTLDVTDVWLVYPGVPTMSVPVSPWNVESLESRTRSARSATLQPLGRTFPIVVSDVRSAPETGITIATETLDQRNALNNALGRGVPLLLNVPPSLGWGVTYEWMAVGDVTEAYFNRGLSPVRTFTLPYRVVTRPVGAQISEWTYTGVLGAYGAYRSLLTAHATYTHLVQNAALTEE